LTTATLAGNGTVKANGGTGGDMRVGGGGGRVAIILTSGTNFGLVTNQALGSVGWAYGNGAAGTVYREATTTQGAGHGELIVDNNGIMPVSRCVALMPPGVNLSDFSRITIQNQGSLGITSNGAVLNFGTAIINGSGATNAFITVYSPGAAVTFPNPFTVNGYTLQLDTPMSYTGNWTIASTGCLSHSGNAGVEAYKLDLAITGNLTVEAGGQINVEGMGYAAGSGPGTGVSYAGGTHGGMGVGVYGGTACALAYGSIIAPTNLGSGGSGSGSSGGGAMRLSVSGLTTVNGMLSAGGQMVNAYGPGAGGSILLTTATLAGNGAIKANGGGAGWDIRAGAGGGRVAVILTSGSSFGSITNQALASVGNNAGPGSAGTIYRQPAGVPAGAGTVTVDNGSAATNFTFTSLPAFSNSTENIRQTVWVTTNKARLGLVTNAAVASLTLNTSGTLELAGHTLTLNAFTVTNKTYRVGIYTPANISLLTDGVGGGKVEVVTLRGTLFIIR